MCKTLFETTYLLTQPHKKRVRVIHRGVDKSFFVEKRPVVETKLTQGRSCKRSTRVFHKVIHMDVHKSVMSSLSWGSIVYKTCTKRVRCLNENRGTGSYEVIHKFTPMMMAGKKFKYKIKITMNKPVFFQNVRNGLVFCFKTAYPGFVFCSPGKRYRPETIKSCHFARFMGAGLT